jgi:hypothetical protein
MTRPAPRLPNFFLAGVSKAGTTSLHRYLDQHPQVFMSPIKEPMFFGAADILSGPLRDKVHKGVGNTRAALQAYLDGPQPPGAEWFVVEWDDYVRLFRDAGAATAVGESSTGYLWLPGAAARIRAAVPEARIAFMLRDPAERLFTLYQSTPGQGPRATFREWFEAALQAPRHWSVALEPARYATHLRRFSDLFPPHQLRVHLFEDYRADAQAVLRDLFAFLDVRPDHPVDVSQRHNLTMVPRLPRLHALRRRLFGRASPTRWLPAGARRALSRLYRRRPPVRPMDPEDRRLAIAYYRDEILRTADLIGRDLSAWLR